MSPWRPRSLVLAALASGVALLAFIAVHDLHEGTFRIYGTTTDVMPHKETSFFVAMALFGSAATWFGALALGQLAGAWLVGAARALARRPGVTVAALAAFAFVATALVSWLSLQHTTVLLDEDLYRFQVDLLRSGRLYAPLPDPLGPFKEFYAVQANGIWTGIYPWGHVAALLPAYVLGMPQLVPHLCAALAVVLTYLLGRELFPEDQATPLLGAAVVALSPFVAFTCGTTHNSTTSLVLVNLGLWGLVRGVRRSSLPFALLAGLAFGLGLHSRPLNALAVALPAGLLALGFALRTRRPALGLVAAFAVGLLPGIAAYLAINAHVTGDALLTPSSMSHPENLQIFGFVNTAVPHTPMLAFGKAGTNLLRLALWTTGSLLAGLALVGFVAGLRRRATDLVLLVPVLAVFACYYFFYTSPGYDTGPLYYLDLVPALALIIGRSTVTLLDRVTVPGDEQPRRLAAGLGVASFAVAFMTFWPMQGIAGRRVTDNNLLPYRAVERAGVRNAVVWFNWHPYRKSWKLPPIPPRPDLSDDVLYARYEPRSALELWNRLRDVRSFHTLVFEDGGARVEPWAPTSPLPPSAR
jgi:hypothetical protein